MAENIVIDFQVDYTQLDAAIATLEKTGKVDKQLATDFKAANNELIKQGALAQGNSKKIGELVQVFDKIKTTATSMGKSVEKAFNEGVADGLEEAGVSAAEFQAALDKATKGGVKSTQTLKQELRSLTEQIAAAKASGGPVDPAMIARAGQLKDAIADANAEIKNAGSDTRGIDNVIGSIQALAGGFAVAQGAAALFGDENEDLQKALLKVNAAMAISQGVQQLLNATQKEGALTKLADATATGLQTAAQRIYTAVTGQATAATVGFKVALAATGIGAAILLVLALSEAFKSTANSVEDANREIESQKNLLEGLNQVIEDRIARQVAQAKLAGKSESELIRIRGRGINAQIEGLEQSNQKLIAQRDQLDATTEAWSLLNNQVEANNNTIRSLGNAAVVEQLNLQKQLADEQKEAAEKAKELAEKAAADAKKRREQELQNRIDAIQKELIEVEKGGAKEVQVRQRLIIAQSALEIAQAEGNEARIALIRAQSLDARYKLQLAFFGNIEQSEKDSRDRILADLDKYIEETNAKIAAQLDYEQRLLDARTGKVRRALNEVASDQDKSVEDRINALSSLERYELSTIDKQIAAVKASLISQEDKDLKLAELEDKREARIEQTEKDITKITNDEEDKRQKKREESIRLAIDIASELASVFADLGDIESQRENNRLSEQKAQLDALVEAGAITEKEANKRQKMLEAQEKQIRQRQAERQKREAVFQALLAIPQAYLKGLTQGGLPLAIVYGAIAAAQAALIASRPIPKFFKGKKDRYEGLGIVGESGAELIERDGQMYIAPRKTITYLGESDKVFTPSETRRMIHDMDKPVMNTQPVQAMKFDYEKLGKMLQSKDVNINIDKDFISESVGNALNKYFNQRYKF